MGWPSSVYANHSGGHAPLLTPPRSMRLPWNRVNHELQQVFRDLRGRVAGLESAPSLDPLREHVSAVDGNLVGLRDTIEDLRDQLATFPSKTTEFSERIRLVERRMDEHTHAIAEGIERTARAERRIGQTVARARQRLADSGVVDEGLEAENRGLKLIDDDDRGIQPQTDPAARADYADQPSSIQGVSASTLRAARGF